MQIDINQLPSPGLRRTFSVLGIRKDEHRSSDERFNDQTPRSFTVSGLLAKAPDIPGAINGEFAAGDGASYILMEPGRDFLIVDIDKFSFRIDKNHAGELSMVSMEMIASNHIDAKFIFHESVSVLIDYLSFSNNVPIRISKLKVVDNENRVQNIEFVSPYRHSFIGDMLGNLLAELRPVYALCREARNSDSPYYQLLCYYKIMEGLSTLKAHLIKRAKREGITPQTSPDVVPDHKDLADNIRPYVGRSIQQFKDSFLTRRYRDAAAHFILREKTILHVSSPQEQVSFSEAAFACEICVRQIIQNYETLALKVQRLIATRTKSSRTQ